MLPYLLCIIFYTNKKILEWYIIPLGGDAKRAAEGGAAPLDPELHRREQPGARQAGDGTTAAGQLRPTASHISTYSKHRRKNYMDMYIC